MSGAVCPSCGVAVVPGYVRCPKCHKPLPRRVAMEGGTAVQTSASKAPLIAVVAAVVVGIAVLAFWSTRSSDKRPAAATPVTEPAQPAPAQTEPALAQTDQAEAPQQPAGPDPASVAASLERTLRKQRLWSTVSVVGERVEVRSGSCEDPAMVPLIDASVPSFKAAGLTKLRCLEQSGRVVTDRDL